MAHKKTAVIGDPIDHSLSLKFIIIGLKVKKLTQLTTKK